MALKSNASGFLTSPTLPTGDISWCLWGMWASTPSVFSSILAIDNNSTFLDIESAGAVTQIEIDPPGSPGSVNIIDPGTNQWFYLAGTAQAASGSTYSVWGHQVVRQHANTTKASTAARAGAMIIAAESAGGQKGPIIIGNLIVYDHLLDQYQLKAQHHQTAPMFQGVWAWLDFISLLRVGKDRSGNGNNFTVSGSWVQSDRLPPVPELATQSGLQIWSPPASSVTASDWASSMPVSPLILGKPDHTVDWEPLKAAVIPAKGQFYDTTVPAVGTTGMIERALNETVYTPMLALQSAVMQWSEPPAVGKWVSGRSLNEAIRDKILPLQSAVMQWSEPPAVGKWISARALNEAIRDKILPLQSAFMQWGEPPAVGKWVSARALNEAVRDDILPLQSAFMQWAEPPAIGKWVSARALNEAIRDRILPLQSAAMQWAEPPAVGKWISARAINESIRDSILPLQSAVMQWAEPPATGRWISGRALNEPTEYGALAVASNTTTMQWGQVTASGKWVSGRPVNESVRDSILPLQSAFMQWGEPPAFGKWVSGRAVNEAIRDRILPLQSAYLQWAEPPLVRSGPVIPNRPENTPILKAAVIITTGSYAEWSVSGYKPQWTVSRPINDAVLTSLATSSLSSWSSDLRPAWQQAYSRPTSQQAIGALLDFAAFTQWGQVTARTPLVPVRMISSDVLGTTPQLGALQWSQAAPLPRQVTSQRPSDGQVHALPRVIVQTSAFLTWSAAHLPSRALHPVRYEGADSAAAFGFFLVFPSVPPFAIILATSSDPSAPAAIMLAPLSDPLAPAGEIEQDLLPPTATILDE